MSGKIDFLQLLKVMENIQSIENNFKNSYETSSLSLSTNEEKITGIHLYDPVFISSYEVRKKKAFKRYDYVRELKAYLKITAKLLSKAFGIYILSFYANLLKRNINSKKAEMHAKLITLLDERLGMHGYKWHSLKFNLLSDEEQDRYLQLIDTHGIDPDYPNIEEYFVTPQVLEENQLIRQFADSIGVTENDLAAVFGQDIEIENTENHLNNYFQLLSGFKRRQKYSYKDIMNAYLAKHPDSKDIIDKYKNDVLSLKDRNWEENDIKQFDGLNIFKLLIKIVIRGHAVSSFVIQKFSSFKELFFLYKEVNRLPLIPIKYDFSLPLYNYQDVDEIKETSIRKQVNFSLIYDLWSLFENEANMQINEFIPLLNNIYLSLILLV
jgi:hypothetical protein